MGQSEPETIKKKMDGKFHASVFQPVVYFSDVRSYKKLHATCGNLIENDKRVSLRFAITTFLKDKIYIWRERMSWKSTEISIKNY